VRCVCSSFVDANWTKQIRIIQTPNPSVSASHLPVSSNGSHSPTTNKNPTLMEPRERMKTTQLEQISNVNQIDYSVVQATHIVIHWSATRRPECAVVRELPLTYFDQTSWVPIAPTINLPSTASSNELDVSGHAIFITPDNRHRTTPTDQLLRLYSHAVHNSRSNYRFSSSPLAVISAYNSSSFVQLGFYLKTTHNQLIPSKHSFTIGSPLGTQVTCSHPRMYSRILFY